MRLSEERGKALLARYGIITPRGRAVDSEAGAASAWHDLGTKVIVKAMIPVGGRGKAGLVRPAASAAEAEQCAATILGAEHGGHTVRTLLIEECLDVAREYYVSVILDTGREGPVLMFSPEGGVDIEEVARTRPESLITLPVDPVAGTLPDGLKDPLAGLDLPEGEVGSLLEFCGHLARAYTSEDLVLAEVNPLVVTAGGSLVAADCKIEVDDSALFRHQEHKDEVAASLSPLESEVREFGGTLVSLEGGDVGVICNGAGMGMAMLDMLNTAGLKPANFLDTGGGPDRRRAHGICSIMLRDTSLKGAIINLWGGFTYLDEVARAIIDVVNEYRPPYPLVVKLLGVNESEAMDLLEGAGIRVARVIETEKAVRMLAEAIEGRN